MGWLDIFTPSRKLLSSISQDFIKDLKRPWLSVCQFPPLQQISVWVEALAKKCAQELWWFGKSYLWLHPCLWMQPMPFLLNWHGLIIICKWNVYSDITVELHIIFVNLTIRIWCLVLLHPQRLGEMPQHKVLLRILPKASQAQLTESDFVIP